MNKFELILDISEKPVFLLDENGRVLNANVNVLQRYGLAACDIIGKKLCDFCQNKDANCDFAGIYSSLKISKKYCHKAVHISAANEEMDVVMNLYSVSEENSGELPAAKVVCVVSEKNCDNLSGHKPALNPNICSYKQMYNVISNLDVFVYIIDPQTDEVIFINEYARKMIGITDAGGAGKCWEVIHGKNERCPWCTNEKLFAGAEKVSTELKNEKNSRWYLETDRLISWGSGHQVKLVTASDINERKQLEILKEDVERIMRHDLKTPLNSIYLISQALETICADEECKYLSGQLNAMMNLSQILYRLEKRDFVVIKRDFSLEKLMKKVCGHLESLCRAVNVSVRVEYCSDNFTIWADELLVYSCLSNLVKNAVEASQGGSEVVVSAVKGDRLDIVKIINMSDVPEDIVPSFFDKYVTKGKQRGTGLGTYSAKLLAEAHGGGISLETGKGVTTVSVMLPSSLHSV
jgi:nitrogen-specific signal transduction histidine kinase